MQYFRTNLTRLKHLMEEKLPDGNDIYEYPGITKNMLMSSLDKAYALSQEIKEGDESLFEVISLKRSGSDLYKSLKEFLDSEDEIKKKALDFNTFLYNYFSLIEKIQIVYFIVAKNGIRDDEELAKIRLRISELSEQAKELKEQKESLELDVKSISNSIEEITNNYEVVKTYTDKINEWRSTINKHYLEMEKVYNSIDGWEEEIEKYGIQYQSLSKQISELLTSSKTSREELNNAAKEGKEHITELEKTKAEHHELLSEIRQTLEGANRVGMAASFNKRKNELNLQQQIWQIVFGIAIALIVVAVWKLILPKLINSTGKWTELAGEIGIVSPLIWLGWFAAKQYGYKSKIREDYAFKAAAAMAYEGHKKAAREVDENLEHTLLELSLYNMSQNPIRLYKDSDIHGTPIHEAMDQVLKYLQKFKKVSAEISPMKVELESKDSTEKEV